MPRVSLVEVRLEYLNFLLRDDRAANAANELFALSAEHHAANHLDPTGLACREVAVGDHRRSRRSEGGRGRASRAVGPSRSGGRSRRGRAHLRAAPPSRPRFPVASRRAFVTRDDDAPAADRRAGEALDHRPRIGRAPRRSNATHECRSCRRRAGDARLVGDRAEKVGGPHVVALADGHEKPRPWLRLAVCATRRRSLDAAKAGARGLARQRVRARAA